MLIVSLSHRVVRERNGHTDIEERTATQWVNNSMLFTNGDGANVNVDNITTNNISSGVDTQERTEIGQRTQDRHEVR